MQDGKTSQWSKHGLSRYHILGLRTMRRGSARTEVIVVNFTNGSVSASLQSHTSATFLDSRSAANIGELSVGSITILTLVTCIKDEESDRVKQYDLSSRISGGRKWELLDPKCELWRVYRVKIKKGQHKIVILENRPLASWMRDLSDSLSLADLCLPGLKLPFSLLSTTINHLKEHTRRWHYMVGHFRNVSSRAYVSFGIHY